MKKGLILKNLIILKPIKVPNKFKRNKNKRTNAE